MSFEMTTLGEFATVQGGYAYKSQDFKSTGEWSVLKIKNVRNGHVSYDNTSFVSTEVATATSKWATKPGDILISMTGSGPSAPESLVGRVARVWKDEKSALINQRVGRLILKESSNIDLDFLFYLLSLKESQDFLVSNSTGSANQVNISAKTIESVPCPKIDHNASTDIASILLSLDSKIRLLRETNTTLEAIAQTLFKSWFVDFDPVRAKQQGREPEGMNAETAALFPDNFEESELGLVPSGWQVERLDNWLSVLETGRRPKGGVAGIQEGVPSIGAESIIRIGQYDYSKIKYVSKEFFDKMKSGALQSNDVLLYKDGGKPGVFLPRVSMFGDGFPFEECGINEHVFRIRLKEPFNQPFLYFWLWSDTVMHELKHRGGKAAIPGINQSDVKEQKIFVPNVDVLHRFNELVSPLVSRIFSNAKKNQTLTQLRDTLLPRLISGQLRLPEAEAIIEEIK